VNVFSIIGYPLSHALSPVIHNAAYEAMGLDARYEGWETPPEEVGAAVGRLRTRDDCLGMNVTVPHKQAVMQHLDEIESTAAAIGAVNTVEKRNGRLIGHNTDRSGYLRSLVEAGCPIKGKSVLIVGYGGVERAIAYALAEAGATSVAVYGRRPEGVSEALAQLRATSPFPMNLEAVPDDERDLRMAVQAADIVVNCTPIGMLHSGTEGKSAVPGEMLEPGQWVSDAVYNPLETELLRLARERGAHAVNGLGMLVYQAADAIKIWTGRDAPVDIMRSAAMKALGFAE
jgi:shikimate dehydrogenase